MVFVGNLACIDHWLSIGLKFLLGCYPAIHVNCLVYSCTHASCMQGCNVYKRDNYKLKIGGRILLCISRTDNLL